MHTIPYRDNPMQYDKSCSNYRNADKINPIEAQKADSMGMPPAELRVWRTSMRTQYGKLAKPGPSATGKKTLTAWEDWILSFLSQHVIHKGAMEV